MVSSAYHDDPNVQPLSKSFHQRRGEACVLITHNVSGRAKIC